MSTSLTVVQDASHQVSLQGDLTAQTVMSAWSERSATLTKLQGDAQPLSVQLDKLENVDTAGLAWLLHLARDCKSKSVALQLERAPAGLVNLAKLSGVDSILPFQ